MSPVAAGFLMLMMLIALIVAIASVPTAREYFRWFLTYPSARKAYVSIFIAWISVSLSLVFFGLAY